MQITFITVKREEENYIFDSVNSLMKEYKDNKNIHIFVGNDDIEYVEQFCKEKELNLHFFSGEQIKKCENALVIQKAMLNAVNALSLDLDQDLLFCEDDIVFKDGWLEHLNKLINMTNNSKIIMLYSSNKYESNNDFIELNSPIPGNQWGTTLCTYFPRSIRKQFHHLLNFNYMNINTALDNQMQHFCCTATSSIILTNPSYVNHTGAKSSIPENKSCDLRLSPMF